MNYVNTSTDAYTSITWNKVWSSIYEISSGYWVFLKNTEMVKFWELSDNYILRKCSRSINKTTSFSTYFWLQPVCFSTVMQDKKMAVINFNDSLNNREQVRIALAHLITTTINVPTTQRNTLLALTVKINYSWELARFLIKIICQTEAN